MNHTKVRSRSAIAVTAFFVAVTFIVLFYDVITAADRLKALTVKHAMTLAVLVGVMYFGHRAWPEFREWRLGSGIGCALLFLAGTGMCVFMSAGRTAEVAAVKNSLARKVNTERAAVEANITKADKAREETRAAHKAALRERSEADTAVRASCKDGKGNFCKGAIATAEIGAQRVSESAEAVKAADEAYWLLIGKLGGMPAAQIENADLKAAAEVMSKLPWVTASEEAIEATLLLVFPFGLALFTEIGAIVGFGLIFDNRPAGRRTVATVATAAPGPGTVSPTPGSRKPSRFPETGTRKPSATVLQLPFKGPRKPLSKAETLAFMQAEITQRGSIPSQDAIAAQCGRRKGTVSRWLRDWERSGFISRQQDGRCKVVASA